MLATDGADATTALYIMNIDEPALQKR